MDVHDGFRGVVYDNLGPENFIEVWPERTATYTLQAFGHAGQVVRVPLTITVQSPVIDYFQASPPYLSTRQPVQLSWRVTGLAQRVDIHDGFRQTTYADLGRENHIMVYPERTATYTLSVYGAQGQLMLTAPLTVTVEIVPVISYFQVNQPDVVSGQGATLTWNVTNATRIELVGGQPPVYFDNLPANGNVGVWPTQPSVYTLRAYRSNGQMVRQPVRVRVRSPQGPHYP